MGKSEILMLLAGVALSIMLAMIAIPMFSSGKDMADRQEVQQELLAIKSAIPLIKALEGDAAGKITATSIKNNMDGFEVDGANLKGKNELATFTITDKTNTEQDVVTVTVTSSKVDLRGLSRLESICDSKVDKANADYSPTVTTTESPFASTLNCVMKRK